MGARGLAGNGWSMIPKSSATWPRSLKSPSGGQNGLNGEEKTKRQGRMPNCLSLLKGAPSQPLCSYSMHTEHRCGDCEGRDQQEEGREEEASDGGSSKSSREATVPRSYPLHGVPWEEPTASFSTPVSSKIRKTSELDYGKRSLLANRMTSLIIGAPGVPPLL